MFGRRKQKDDTAAIGEFWLWWAGARGRVQAAIEDGSVASLADELNERVAAIHRDLQWELTKGARAHHALVVSPGGNPALRAAAARWRAAGPSADEVFEYFDARQPDEQVFDARIQIAGHDLELAELRFAVTATEDAHDLDVGVFHPAFPEMPEGARVQLTFLALDWALGEQQVELWIGQVEPLAADRPGLVTFAELRAAVADLAAKHAEPVYAMLTAEDRRRPTGHGDDPGADAVGPLAALRPAHRRHSALPCPAQRAPDRSGLTELRDLEDRIESVLPPDGEVIAHETTGGVRTIHVYADSTTDKADAVSSVAEAFRPLKTTVAVTADPAYEGVAHLRP